MEPHSKDLAHTMKRIEQMIQTFNETHTSEEDKEFAEAFSKALEKYCPSSINMNNVITLSEKELYRG